LAEDRTLPGFGHPLYPEGDPRAAALLARTTVPRDLRRLAQEAEEITGLRPNVDFALLAMAQTLDLPEEAPFMLFAVGRCAGWIAHAIEQERTGDLIRPRARYVGVEV
jgi:citrate synthase